MEQIAFEKAGIIKPKVPVVVGAMKESAQAVILARAAQLDAPVCLMGHDYLLGHDYEVSGFVRTGYRGTCSIRVYQTIWKHITLNCPAAFMATNAAHAMAAFQTLCQRERLPALTEDHVRRTLETVILPACCEVFPGRPTVVIDGSHNAMAAASLSVTVRTLFEGRDRVLIVGIPRDKEVEQLIAHFADCGARRVIFTRYPGIRATAPEKLAALWQRRSATPAEVSVFYTERALEYIRSQPLDWLALLGRKLLLALNAVELVDTVDHYTFVRYSLLLRATNGLLHFGVLAPLAALGLFVTRSRWRRLWPLYGLLSFSFGISPNEKSIFASSASGLLLSSFFLKIFY